MESKRGDIDHAETQRKLGLVPGRDQDRAGINPAPTGMSRGSFVGRALPPPDFLLLFLFTAHRWYRSRSLSTSTHWGANDSDPALPAAPA